MKATATAAPIRLNLRTAEEWCVGGCVGAGIVSEWNLSGSNWDNIMIKVDNNESFARFTAHSGSNNNTSNKRVFLEYKDIIERYINNLFPKFYFYFQL